MYYYILNPAAGRGTVNSLQDKLRQRLTELGIAGEFAKTTGPNDATAMAKAAMAKGHNTIVAVGGDGTVNEVLNGITKHNVAVGIIPMGHTNLLANRLGIFNWQQACAVLAARRLTSYALIAAGSQFFLSTLTLGFETDLDKRVDTTASGRTARLRQLWEGYGHGRAFSPLKCQLILDDGLEVNAEVFSLRITNQKFDNPLAENRLIISLTDRPNRTRLTGLLWQMLHRDSPIEETPTTRLMGQRVLIATDPPTGLTIDGKLAGRTPIAIRLTDRRIRFITEKPDNGFQAG